MPSATEPSGAAFERGTPAGLPEVSFRRILVPIDCFGAFDDALMVAGRVYRAVGGPLRLIHVRTWEQAARGGGRYFAETSGEATTTLDKAIGEAWAMGLQASGVVIEAHRNLIALAVISEAARWDADVIVVTKRRRRTLGVLLSGSVSDQIMLEASCPVLVVRRSKP
jgi:nucleotide-binding universal stress UspA family protein